MILLTAWGYTSSSDSRLPSVRCQKAHPKRSRTAPHENNGRGAARSGQSIMPTAGPVHPSKNSRYTEGPGAVALGFVLGRPRTKERHHRILPTALLSTAISTSPFAPASSIAPSHNAHASNASELRLPDSDGARTHGSPPAPSPRNLFDLVQRRIQSGVLDRTKRRSRRIIVHSHGFKGVT